MYNRTYNFSAGPATMPVPVLEEIRDELLNYRGAGMGVMEMSHRSKVFQTIIDEAEQDLRDLMGIPDNYKVLFIQGGATLQFAMIPMNLMKNKVADYIMSISARTRLSTARRGRSCRTRRASPWSLTSPLCSCPSRAMFRTTA